MRKAVTGHSSSIIGSPQVSKVCVIMKQRKQKNSVTAEEEKKKLSEYFISPLKTCHFKMGRMVYCSQKDKIYVIRYL